MVHGQSRRFYHMGSATACFELGLFNPLLTEQIKECSICLLHLQTIHKQDATATLLDVELRIQNTPNQLDKADDKTKIRCNSTEGEQGNTIQRD